MIKPEKIKGKTVLAVTAVITVAAVMWAVGWKNSYSGKEGADATSSAAVVQTTEPETIPETASEAETVPEDTAPKLEADQIALLDELTVCMVARDFEQGGSLLLEHEQKLQYLFYQIMEGKRYLYQDGKLSEELEGEGLVFQKPSTVFYGTFQNEMPEGEGVALQGIILEEMRYDYADGMWKHGKLNGEGTVGYHYYKGIEGEESQAVERKGIFADDLMDGAFTYQTTSMDGEVTVWDMEAEAGRTKLNERWLHNDEKQYYYLPSNENSSHTYVLSDSDTEEIRWRNMLLWEE